jgi:hypothetical protein
MTIVCPKNNLPFDQNYNCRVCDFKAPVEVIQQQQENPDQQIILTKCLDNPEDQP